jgi:biotin operon repressor
MINSLDSNSRSETPRKRGPRPQVVDRVARAIQKRLANGHYAAATYLPAERQLADELQTSRTSVAAAIQRLEDIGLVERHPGRGSYIRPKIDQTICLVHTLYPGYYLIFNEVITLLQGARDALGVSSLATHELSRSDWRDDPLGACENPVGMLLIKLGDHIISAVRDTLARGVPCVVANLEQDYPDIPASCVDHQNVTRRATELLINMGHRRIGYIGNEADRWFYTAALNGYVQTMRSAGLDATPQLIEMVTGSMALAGYIGARALLERDHPPTAIVVARDGYAEGVCKAAEEKQLIIGRDLSVIGYDDLTWPLNPDYLTTFAHPGI